jgi:hypothetical protein
VNLLLLSLAVLSTSIGAADVGFSGAFIDQPDPVMRAIRQFLDESVH